MTVCGRNAVILRRRGEGIGQSKAMLSLARTTGRVCVCIGGWAGAWVWVGLIGFHDGGGLGRRSQGVRGQRWIIDA